ncbi:MAG TPA: rhodanese-like domain-containing protein [Williamwhitmania sp.]|nr:rhodanese-like domain-containing protein [Williamwhitmania sp.]
MMNQEIKGVSVAVAIERISNGALLIDVREWEEIEMVAYGVDGHLQIPQSEFSIRFNEIPRNREIIVGCHSGNRSRTITIFLLEQGFGNVLNLDGGIRDWMEQELPVTWDNAIVKNTLPSNAI